MGNQGVIALLQARYHGGWDQGWKSGFGEKGQVYDQFQLLSRQTWLLIGL